MFSTSNKTSVGDQNVSGQGNSLEFSLRTDYYGGDFVEDGSFLVLSTDRLSLSPTTPPEENITDEEDKMDIEVIGGSDEDVTESTPTSVGNCSLQAQVLGEDPESSVESGASGLKEDTETIMSLQSNGENRDDQNSMVNMSMVSTSSNSTTDTHLNASSEEVSKLMVENKELGALVVDSNEKMKELIAATEKLQQNRKSDHEEYISKHEQSRETILQLRQENELLKSQLSLTRSKLDMSEDSQNHKTEAAVQEESLQRQNHAISELNERLETVLTVNGQLNDQLSAAKDANDTVKVEINQLRTDHEDNLEKIQVMRQEIDTGRQTISKFNEHRVKNETELVIMKNELADTVKNMRGLEAVIEEKTKLTDGLRRNMEDMVTALERCNQKLNQKEEEIILLHTKIAAINAEADHTERVQVLEVQCQTYLSDFEKEREERGKLAAERDALLNQLNLVTQQLKEKVDALDNYSRQYRGREHSPEISVSRNDNPAANSNDSLPSPLTSLPSVAGHLVGFVRRELLGWEDQSGNAVDGNQRASDGSGSSEAVVQQPKQESIPPCPLCRKVFPTLEKLQRHAANCGIENFADLSDPFVFP